MTSDHLTLNICSILCVSFATMLDSEPLSFQNEVRYLKYNLLWFDDCPICMPNLAKFGLRPFELAHLGICNLLKSNKNISLISNNSAVHLLTVFRYDSQCAETPETGILNIHFQSNLRQCSKCSTALALLQWLLQNGEKCEI